MFPLCYLDNVVTWSDPQLDLMHPAKSHCGATANSAYGNATNITSGETITATFMSRWRTMSKSVFLFY